MSGASHQEWALKPQCQHVSEEDLPGRWTHQLDISIQRVRRESPGPAFWKRIRLKCRRSAAWILSCAKVYWTSKKIEVCEVYPSWKTKTLIFEHQTQSKIGNSPQFSEMHLFSDWVCKIRHPHVTQKRRGDSETTMEVKNMPCSFCRKIIVLERNFGLGWYHMTPKLALWLSQHKPFCKKNVDVHHLRGRPFRALAMSATSSAVSWIPLVIKASSVSGQT